MQLLGTLVLIAAHGLLNDDMPPTVSVGLQVSANRNLSVFEHSMSASSFAADMPLTHTSYTDTSALQDRRHAYKQETVSH